MQHKIVYKEYKGIYKIAKDDEMYLVLDGRDEEIERVNGFDEAYSLLQKYISQHKARSIT